MKLSPEFCHTHASSYLFHCAHAPTWACRGLSCLPQPHASASPETHTDATSSDTSGSPQSRINESFFWTIMVLHSFLYWSTCCIAMWLLMERKHISSICSFRVSFSICILNMINKYLLRKTYWSLMIEGKQLKMNIMVENRFSSPSEEKEQYKWMPSQHLMPAENNPKGIT